MDWCDLGEARLLAPSPTARGLAEGTLKLEKHTHERKKLMTAAHVTEMSALIRACSAMFSAAANCTVGVSRGTREFLRSCGNSYEQTWAGGCCRVL